VMTLPRRQRSSPYLCHGLFTHTESGLPLPTSPESDVDRKRPGPVRRLWWRTPQPARLAIMCLGVLSALVTTGAAGFLGDDLPRAPGNSGIEAVHRGDAFEVTVHTVSDVDLFEGVEPATGVFFHAQVAGIRRISNCWLAESRDSAQNLLRGKTVWLTVKKDGGSGTNEIPVDVKLPDGADYAQTVVHDGAATADMSTRGELMSVEAAARVERRGVWATACAPGAVPATPSSTPSSSSSSSSSPVPTTTTTAAPVPTSSPESSPAPPVTTTSSPPSDDDDEWIVARLGKPCLIEGARRTSPKGSELTCSRDGKDRLRWRRAD
jgi:endonuclease YncB( thermonuclease family)